MTTDTPYLDSVAPEAKTIDVRQVPYKDIYIVRVPADPERNSQILSALDDLFTGLKHGACVTLTEEDHKMLMRNITLIKAVPQPGD